MKFLSSAVTTINSMGAGIILPFIFFIVGLIFRMKIRNAIKAGLMIGIGFQGINMAVNFLMTVLGPAQEYYIAQGTGFTVTDMPWPAVGAMPFTAPWAIISIPVMAVLSYILVRLKVFKTLNLDIWGYGQFLLGGSFAWLLSDNMLIGVLVTFILFFLCLFLADRFGPRWSESLGMPNTTNSTLLWMSMGGSVCWVVNKILDLIPFVKDINISPKWMQSKMGIFGETSVIGAILGAILGTVSRQNIAGIITMSMGLAASMVLLPHILKIFMEGMGLITTQATSWATKKLGEEKEVYFAVDIAMTVGSPCAITVGALLVPFTILMSFVLPNFSYFPIGFMTVVVYLGGWCSMYCKQNFFRALISAFCLVIVCLLVCQFVAPEATIVTSALGVETTGEVTSVVFADWIYVIMSFVKRLFV